MNYTKYIKKYFEKMHNYHDINHRKKLCKMKLFVRISTYVRMEMHVYPTNGSLSWSNRQAHKNAPERKPGHRGNNSTLFAVWACKTSASI